MSDGGLLKPEKDFTKEADKLIPEAEALAKVRLTSLGLDDNADTLFCRPMSRVPSTSCWSWRSKHDRYDLFHPPSRLTLTL
jgi:hypothetical protein